MLLCDASYCGNHKYTMLYARFRSHIINSNTNFNFINIFSKIYGKNRLSSIACFLFPLYDIPYKKRGIFCKQQMIFYYWKTT